MNEKKNKRMKTSWKNNPFSLIFFLVILMIASAVGSLTYISRTSKKLMDYQAPLMDAAVQMKLELTNAHLNLEEVIAGDPDLQMDDVVTSLQNAQACAETILQACITKIGGLKILNDPQIHQNTEEITEKLSDFKQKTLRRWDVKEVAAIGSEIDRQYNEDFRNLAALMNEVKVDVTQAVDRGLLRVQRIYTSLIIGSFALVVIVALIIIYRLRTQQKTHKKLFTANLELSDGNRRLRETEEQLLRTNQKLEEWIKQRTDELQKGNELLQTEINIRKLAQEQVDIFKLFAEASKEGLGMTDLDGNITYVNSSLANILGAQNPDRLSGTNVRKYYRPEDIPKLEEVLALVLREGHQAIEMPLVSTESKETPSIQSIFLIKDEKGKPFRLANVITDITELKKAQQQLEEHKALLEETVAKRTAELEKYNRELQNEIADRKRAEIALRESEQNFKSLINIAPTVILSLSPDYKILEFNKEAEEIFGCKRDDALGKNYLETFLPEDVRSRVAEDIKKVLDGQSIRNFENNVISLNGDEHIVSWNVDPIVASDGSKLGIIAIGQDVTKRKKTEDALRFTQFAVDRASVAAYWIGQDGQLFYVNDTACKLLNYSREELLSKTIYDIDPNMTPENWPLEWSRLREKACSVMETLHRTKDARLVPVEIAANFIEFDAKQYNCAFAMDITERKKAEEALRNSLQTSHDIVEAIPSGLLLYQYEPEDKLILLDGNPEAKRLTGINLKECIGKEFNEIWPQAKQAGITDAYLNVAKTGQPFESEELYYEDRNLKRIFRVRVFQLPQNRLASAFENVAERKKAEEALRNSEQTLRSYIDNAPDGVMVVNREGRYVEVNKAACNITGYSKDELLNMSIYDMLAPESHQAGVDHFNSLVNNGCASSEMLYKTKDGQISFCSVDAAKISEDRFLGFVKDITERKKAERQIQQHRAELAHSWRLNTMGEMSTGMAHELNQPLCAVLNYAQACSRLVKDKEHLNFSELDKSLEQIITQTSRAGEIIRRIRQLIGKRETERAPVNVNSIVKEVLDMESAEAGQKNVTIETMLDEQLPLVFADRIEIEQVVLNLVRNAFEAMSHQEPDQCRLTIRTTKADDSKVMVEVADTGKGLSSEEKEKVFDPFFTTTPGGLGVGLSISRTIIEAHYGRIWMESNPGEGAAFKFVLPVAED